MKIAQSALVLTTLSVLSVACAAAQQKPIAIVPASPTVLPERSIPLRVESNGQCPAGVTWTVNDATHPLPSDGSLIPTGKETAIYTAPKAKDISATSPPPTVKATCHPDDNLQASVTVIINVASCPPVTVGGNASASCVRLRPETAVVEVRNPNKPGKHSTAEFTLDKVPPAADSL